MKSEPTVRLSHAVIVEFSRKRALNALENHAKRRHQIVPVTTNVNPSRMNASVFDGASESMNWGRKARKNKATFGLRIFVTIPWRNAATALFRLKCWGSD